MLLTVKWWIVVETAASQAHVMTLELILLLYIRYWLSIEPLLFTAQCSWFLVLSSEAHLFKMGFQKDGCKQFQFWGHDTWVTTSITVNLLPSSDYSDFDPDSSLGFLPLVFTTMRISFLICFLRIEHWFFFPQIVPCLTIQSWHLNSYLPWVVTFTFSNCPTTPITHKSHQLHLGQWWFWG